MVRKSVVFAGSVGTRSGYGARARDIARALIKSEKYDVKIIPLRWGNTPQDALDVSNPDDKIILDRIVSGQLTEQPDIFIHLTIPNEFQRAGKYNIGITAGIETTLCRAEWIEGCNRMDLVLTSSNHSKVVFQDAKYEKRDKVTNTPIGILSLERPVEVLFEGVDLEIYTNKAADSDVYKQISQIESKFCFLFVGHFLQGDIGHDRKDIAMLVKTFLETFKNKKNKPALILKTSLAGFSEPEYQEILKKIQDIRNFVRATDPTAELPNVHILHGALSDSEMNDLYNHPKVKAMVSFTHGEGFGRPLLEFTVTGKPVIASNWSGQTDFLHNQYSVLLPGVLEDVHISAINDWIIQGSKWFRVNYDTASKLLLNVYEKYDTYLAMSSKHRDYTIGNFSLQRMGEILTDYIDRVADYADARSVSMQPTQLKLPKLKLANPQESITLPKLKRV